MRFAFIFCIALGVLLGASRAQAQDVDVDEVLRGATAERARARCMLRAAGKSERLAARYRRARSDAARARLAEQLAAIPTERQVCLDAVDVGRSIGTAGVLAPRPASVQPVRVRLHGQFVRPNEDARELRRVWARARGHIQRCVEHAHNDRRMSSSSGTGSRGTGTIESFTVSYEISDAGQVGSVDGAPPHFARCFQALRRILHPDSLHGLRVMLRLRIQELEPPREQNTLYDPFAGASRSMP